MELTTRHKQCLEALKNNGPCTAREVANYMNEKGYLSILERNIAHPRLNELCNEGLVEKESLKKLDPETNRKVTVYKIKN